MDEITTTLAIEGVKLIVAEIVKRFPTNEKRWSELRDRLARDAVPQLENALYTFMDYQIDKNQQTAEQLGQKLDVETAERLFSRLFFESMHATTKERTRLLCAALAGSLNPDFDTELKSRITRAILELEPSDVVLLRRLTTSGTYDIPDQQVEREAQYSHDALNRAGCLDFSEGGYGGGRQTRVTQLGRDLVRYLAAWTPEADSSE